MDERRHYNTREQMSAPTLRAAAYVRMSTEHQQYSTQNQLNAIQEYALHRGIEIVKLYEDEGKSGLRLEGRDALKQLLRDVENGQANFELVLVYDVSRWGRFQDPDESASYEIRCKQGGVHVRYCAEQFENDGSPVSSIIKSVKRTMAGEYSRELGIKVFGGQSRLISLGFRQGGSAGFGLRRQLIDVAGSPKGLLSRGEHKCIQTDRVILVPGPESEQNIVRFIYKKFVEEGRSEQEIAGLLNQQGIRTDLDRLWTRGTVHQILINEKYIGNNVWNRTSFKLKQEHVRNPCSEWIRAEGVFKPIVEYVLFVAAQSIIASRSERMSDDQMLDALRKLFARCGYLSGMVIDESEDCPSSSAYQSRFGSLVRSYSLIGYQPNRDFRYVEENRQLRTLYPLVVQGAISNIRELGGHVVIDAKTELITVNEEFTISLVLSRCRITPAGSLRWVVRFDSGLAPDITVVVRMAVGNELALDYYLLPAMDMLVSRLRLAERNEAGLDAYRFDNLDALFHLAQRVPIRDLH